ncbi:MAG TPA: proton-conducting transporter membrane subunit, partial [Candidatus Binatia bacterium]
MNSQPILEHLWIIPLLPLVGAAINGLFGAKFSNQIVSAIALSSTGLSFLAAIEAAREFVTDYYPQHGDAFVKPFFDWIAAGNFRAGFDLQMDQLTVVMVLVVTGVGFLIHIYSTGYMAHEGGYYRFFSYLNLFMFFMLILVLAANYVLLFVGWEGVGLASYLLIGFYFLKKSASDAGKKAFIVNRIGDFGFLIGIFMIIGTMVPQLVHPLPVLNFGFMKQYAPILAGVAPLITFFLFVGATGKSAQIPLYVWLPDAMAGPTPVSALIHAATMVTAGIYMIARLHFLFDLAPQTLELVATVGAATALFAALIGLVQNDI